MSLTMKPSPSNKRSHKLRQFKPTKKPASRFCISLVFADACLLTLAFFLLVSPFVLQPGINIKLPQSPFTGGAPFNSMVLSITKGGWFYFNDERLNQDQLTAVLKSAAKKSPSLPLIIEADEQVTHGDVIRAWNAALAAGIKNVSIATQISAINPALPWHKPQNLQPR